MLLTHRPHSPLRATVIASNPAVRVRDFPKAAHPHRDLVSIELFTAGSIGPKATHVFDWLSGIRVASFIVDSARATLIEHLTAQSVPTRGGDLSSPDLAEHILNYAESQFGRGLSGYMVTGANKSKHLVIATAAVAGIRALPKVAVIPATNIAEAIHS